MLSSFFSFFLLIFSTVAFAGDRAHNWEPTVGTYTNDVGEKYYIGYAENVADDGSFAFVSSGNPTYSQAEAKHMAKNKAKRMNDGAGTSVSDAMEDAEKKDKAGKFVLFGIVKKGGKDKTRDEIIASQDHDCAVYPMTPGCETPMGGKELPTGGTKGVKAGQ